MFRYEPRDIMAPVKNKMPGIDSWHRFSNTRASHKGIVGRYDPVNGDLLRIQQFNTLLLEKGRFPVANAFRMDEGGLWADADGTVYITGRAATGLPIRHAPRFANKAEQTNFNPFDRNTPTKGVYLMIMSPELDKRLYTTRLSIGGNGTSVHGRNHNGHMRVAWAGNAGLNQPSFIRNALQASPGWGKSDAYFAFLNNDSQHQEQRLSFSLLSDQLVPQREQSVNSDELRTGSNQQSVTGKRLSLALDTTSPLFTHSQDQRLKIYGGSVAEVHSYNKRKVNKPRFSISSSGELSIAGIDDNKMRLEKTAQARQWSVFYGEITGPGKTLTPGQRR